MEKIYQKIKEVTDLTGLSQSYIRKRCKEGSIPRIMSGGVYYINVPLLLEQLKKGAEAN